MLLALWIRSSCDKYPDSEAQGQACRQPGRPGSRMAQIIRGSMPKICGHRLPIITRSIKDGEVGYLPRRQMELGRAIRRYPTS